MEDKNILSIQDKFFKNLNSSILKNIDNTQYSIEDLCEDCLVSRSQLHRKIKEETGLSTTLYIRDVKLQKAKELLNDSSLTVSEISYACGFSSPQTLSRYFSSSFGISPSQYRSEPIVKNKSSQTSEPAYKKNDEKAHQQKTDSISNNLNRKSSYEIRTEIDNENETEEEFYAVEFDQAFLKNKKTFLFGILTILVSLIGLYWIYNSIISKDTFIPEDKITNSPHFKNSIAVLPFLNLGSADNEHFCAGIQEDILTKLAYFKDLKVISRTSMATYKNTEKSILQIGSELGVAYILEGSVRMQNDQLAITAQLIRSSDDFHVWAENYVRKVDDIFKIQNEISLKIAEVLNQKISSKTESQITNSYQPNKEAYNEYLIGKEMLKDRTHTSLLGSIGRFNKALYTDPKYIDAMVSKANAYQLLGNIGYDHSEEYISKSQQLSLEVIKLDPNNAQAYAILACHYRDAHQWEQAKVTFEIALDRNPNDPMTNYWYSLMLRELGELDQAIIYSKLARELDPLYPVIHGGHIVNLAYADLKDQAEAAIKEGDVLFQQSFLHHWAKAIYAESIFDYQAAIKAFEKVLMINPELISARNAIFFNKARLGQTDEVQAFFETIQTNSGPDLFARATLYAGLEDGDQFADLISKAMDKGVYPSDILVDKNYNFLRNHRKYSEILEKYNLLAYINNSSQ